ncbi:MAG: tetratricopeptide (TPR) repeat protein [Motiliproteus sp.]|jgi:tetratricopeptide (TPR) repeat protein
MSRCLMNRFAQQKRWLLGLGALGLVGCASQSGFSVPVEDRSSPGSRPLPTADAVASPESGASAAPSSSSAMSFPDPFRAPEGVERAPVPAADYSGSRTAAPEMGKYAGPAPVLLALMEQADNLEARGDRQGALAQLERAQRIAPRDPLVYLQLARLRLHMDDRVRAEQLARKGLLLSGGDSELRLAFEALLAELKSR